MGIQEILEEVVRWLGYVVLRALTLGRYRGGTEAERLPEGAVGLGVLVAVVAVSRMPGSSRSALAESSAHDDSLIWPELP